MATVNVILPAEQGDALNYLDGNAMSKGDIINVLQRMGGVANRLDFRKAAALGSTFLSLGAAPEIARVPQMPWYVRFPLQPCKASAFLMVWTYSNSIPQRLRNRDHRRNGHYPARSGEGQQATQR